MKSSARRFPVVSAISFALCAAAPAHPHEGETGAPDVSVEFLVGGRPLPQYPTRGGGMFVTAPRWGVEYEIRICNRERHDRVLFVIGVDGLSVMDGTRASKNSGGYVLRPGETHRIRGWRRGDDRVAAFTFTSRDDSYAGRTGRRSHIGEVWVWAIREQKQRPRPLAARAAESDARKAGARFHPHTGETGTGYGEELEDHVYRIDFARSNSIRRLNFLYGLGRRVEARPRREAPRGGYLAQPFAPPPPGWRR